MASLIPENGVIFNCADVAPPPSKDYCQIIVTREHVSYLFCVLMLNKPDFLCMTGKFACIFHYHPIPMTDVDIYLRSH